MQKNMLNKAGRLCLMLLSLTLLSQSVYGADNKMSYLDNVSRSYIYNGDNSTDRNILNSNSVEAKGIEATLKLDSNPVFINSNKKVNLSLRDSDIRQVLRMLADKAGMNIAFDESVDGKVTLDLNNISIGDAFSIIFKSSQLTYNIDGNTIIVMKLDSAKNAAYSRKNMTVIPVKYVNADSVASFLNSNLFNSNVYGLSGKPIVTSNPRTNQLVIFGSAADVAAAKRVLPVLDTKPMINSYKVAHTTPKEMATLICDSLFSTGDGSSSSGGGSSSSGGDDEIVLGGGTIACRASKNSSGGSSSGDNLASFEAAPLTVTYFSDLGRISVYGGSPEQAEMVKEFIKDHDKKQLMAYIELSVIELNEEGSREFSNTWNLWTPFISLGFDPASGTFGTGARPVVLWDKDGNVRHSNNHALTYTLNYLIDNHNGRVLTNPKIMVTNGRKATIDMTSDYIKSITSQVLTNNGVEGVTQKTYEIGNDDGLLIEILPFISPDGYVSMNISPEFATIKEQITSRNEADPNQKDVQATLLQRRDLELKNIRIKDGETLVLAGMIKENETQNIRKMPFLSDLPVVGALFRGSDSKKSREELVIVVTPHIVRDDEPTNSNVYDL